MHKSDHKQPSHTKTKTKTNPVGLFKFQTQLIYLFKISGFDGAFLRDRELVLLTGSAINNGQGATEIAGW
jgi:hypothetical protein